ncbi:MAG TPA: crosslink repair DNA glycosylase YcaQ family protein [Bryobacteraceae bacterium]|nr:crosslink repair DNA glycosylase YcaQ family protein [Bryobacteraceae bacterium]
MRTSLSLQEARRLALAAQGFDQARPPRATAVHLRRTIRRLGLLQIDFVNVVCAAHYMVPFSRVGPYDRKVFETLVYKTGEFAEHWAHEISIIPVETWPLLRYRRETDRVRPWGFARVLEERAEYAGWVLEEVRRRGMLAADDLPAPDGAELRLPGAWIRTIQRGVLEAHFVRGNLAAAARRADFSRVYALAERLIPEKHRCRQVEYDEGRRALLLQAARAHGVGTAKDLADYFRMPVRDAVPRLRELVDSGKLLEARVEGWREPAYLDPKAKLPPRVDAAALLSPFDPLIWCRPRVQRLFGFEYRLEVFVPPGKRKYGFYVLPFLLGESLVARVDLKADRAQGRLQVLGTWFEGRKTAAVDGALRGELRVLGEWLGLKVTFR